jgi:hypothetical protein
MCFYPGSNTSLTTTYYIDSNIDLSGSRRACAALLANLLFWVLLSLLLNHSIRTETNDAPLLNTTMILLVHTVSSMVYSSICS